MKVKDFYKIYKENYYISNENTIVCVIDAGLENFINGVCITSITLAKISKGLDIDFPNGILRCVGTAKVNKETDEFSEEKGKKLAKVKAMKHLYKIAKRFYDRYYRYLREVSNNVGELSASFDYLEHRENEYIKNKF